MSLNEEIIRRSQNRDNVIRSIRLYSKKLEDKLGKITLILFGSYARGDFNLWSDVDIIIISEYFENIRFMDRPFNLPELYKDISYADIICWDLKESEKMLSKSSWKFALNNAIIIKNDYNLIL
ncbi:MAG: nucleotidyltransferase domain-containing protein [Ferroplasma sp.]